MKAKLTSRTVLQIALLAALISSSWTLLRWTADRPGKRAVPVEPDSGTSEAVTLVLPQRPEAGGNGEEDPGPTVTLLDPTLFRLLEEPERKSRLEVLRRELESAATAEDLRVRAEHLTSLDDADAIEVLVEAQAGETSEERREALSAALQAAPGIDQEAREIITSIVASPLERSLREEASDAVSRFANDDAVAHLLELYAEPGASEEVAGGIERSIANIRNPAAAEALGSLVDGSGAPLAEAAMTALRGIPARESAEALIAAARRNEADPDRQNRILEAISSMRISPDEEWQPIPEGEVFGPLEAAIDLMLRTSRFPLPPHRM